MTKPITLKEMNAWADKTWEKCQSEAWKEPREWVGLTLQEIEKCIYDANNDPIVACRNVEAKLKEKNT